MESLLLQHFTLEILTANITTLSVVVKFGFHIDPSAYT